jgi:lipopolysaccharide transport system permease protein
MVGLIDGFRWALVGGTEAPVAALATSVVVIAIVLVAGLIYFRRVERTFADVI